MKGYHCPLQAFTISGMSAKTWALTDTCMVENNRLAIAAQGMAQCLGEFVKSNGLRTCAVAGALQCPVCGRVYFRETVCRTPDCQWVLARQWIKQYEEARHGCEKRETGDRAAQCSGGAIGPVRGDAAVSEAAEGSVGMPACGRGPDAGAVPA